MYVCAQLGSAGCQVVMYLRVCRSNGAVTLEQFLACPLLQHFGSTANGQIQGDGRKFLDHFKSYFGSQISSQSLNEVHLYRLQPKSGTKGDFFHIFVSLIVSSSQLMLPFDVWPSFPVTTWTVPWCRFWQDSRTHDSTFSDCNCFRTFSVVFNCRSLFNEAAYLAALHRLRSPFAIRDADSKQSKTKILKTKLTFCCGFRLQSVDMDLI